MLGVIVETVRLMMNMFDRDNDGTINFHEFIGLWNYIEKWKACFQTYDLDGSGTIDAHELQRALRGFGFNLSEVIVDLIVTKYDVRGRGDISFDNFVQSCVTVQTLTDAFRRIDVAGTGVVTMTYEQVMIYLISLETILRSRNVLSPKVWALTTVFTFLSLHSSWALSSTTVDPSPLCCALTT